MQIIGDCVGCSRRSYGQPLHRRLIHLQTCSQMEEGRPERNVAAILATDFTGLSRHIQDDENLTIRTYRPHEATLLKRHQGFFVAAPLTLAAIQLLENLQMLWKR